MTKRGPDGAMQLEKLTRTIRPEYSVTKVAGLVGVSVPTVYSWLHRESTPSLQRALILEEKFGIPVDSWQPVTRLSGKRIA